MKLTLPVLGTLFNRKAIFPRRSPTPFRSRLLSSERLETRAMLAADALSGWQNQLMPADVNADGHVSSLDALRVINELNTGGARQLIAAPATPISRFSFVAAGTERSNYYDVNGDGYLTSTDALTVINQLNAVQGEQVRVRVEVTDLAGNPIDTLALGQEFQIRGFVKDLREPANDPQRGAFSVYFDVNYDPTKMEVDLDGRTIEYTAPYTDVVRPVNQITATPGLLDDIGAQSATLSPVGSNELLIFTVPMKATANGAVAITTNPEDSDLREVTVFGSNDAVPDNEIRFEGDQVAIGFPPTAAADTSTVAEDSTGNAIDVLGNDTVNPQGQPPLLVTAVTNGAHGTVTIGTGGENVQYTPNADYNGPDTFTYTAEDADGNQAIGTVTVTVTPVNDPPTANDDEFPVEPGSANNELMVLVNDSFAPDVGETLRISAVGMGNRGGTISTAANGQFLRYTPNATFRGDETFIYTVEDGNGLTDTATVVVHVGNNNPIAGSDSFTDIFEDSTDNPLDVLANDQLAEGVEGNLLIVGTGTTSNGGTVTIVDGAKSLLYTPRPDFFGTETFTYRVVDGQGGEQTGNVTVTVTNVNDPPTANDDTKTVDEDTTDNIINVLANDSIAPDAGETLTITAVGPTDNNGTVTIAPGGTHLLYTPAPDFFGAETFTYTISDGNGETDTATVTVTVNDVNEQPIATDDTATVAEDSTDNIINVLTNDTDADGDTLTITAVGNGSQGGTIQIADGATSIRYTPAQNVFGTETFTYTISDGNGGSDTATVTVTITPVNDNPDAVDDTLPVLQDSSNNTLNVLANDLITPDEGETLTITAVGETSGDGTVTIANDNRSLVYTPAAGFVGSETFTYTITDGNGGTDTAMVTVQVGNVNDPPVAVDDTATVLEDAAATTINVLTNDTDADGDTLAVTAVGATNHGGTVTIATDGHSVVYTPFANFNGTETFTYTVSDGNSGSDTATVTVTVTPVNDVPPSDPDTFTVAEDSTNNTLDVLMNDLALSNPDGAENITIASVSTGSAEGTITVSEDRKTILYTPKADFSGTETFTYTITDNVGATSAPQTVTVTITAANDNPTPANDVFEVNRGSSNNTLNVLANDTDPDAGDTLTITAFGTRSNGGTVTIAEDGKSLRYMPAAGFVGTETFTYTVSDGHGGTAMANVSVNVKDFAPGSLSGTVYVDTNGDGTKQTSEQALANVTIRLWGKDVLGQSVDITTTTDSTGAYRFDGVLPGSYVIEETQPSMFMDSVETLGTAGGTAGHDQFFLALGAGQNGTNYNFTERGLMPQFIGRPNFFLP